MESQLQLLVSTDLWITISHLLDCLPTLELTTFEQQVCSTKVSYANAQKSLGTNSCKKRNVAALNNAHQAKKQCNLDSNWLEQTAVRFTELTLNFVFPLKLPLKLCSRTTTKPIVLLQLEHEFCQQNGPDCGQVHDRYPNEKMVVVPVFFNGRYYSSGPGVLNGINKDEGEESLSLLALQRDVVNAIFLKYSAECRLSSSHVEIGNIASEVCYNDTKSCQVQSEHRHIQNPFKHLRWNVFA